MMSLELAERAIQAVFSEASARKLRLVAAIVDSGGHLVILKRMDDVPYGSVDAALQKAGCAASFRKPTFELEVKLEAGRLAYLALSSMVANGGGVPLYRGGEFLGAIGISGASSAVDHEIADFAAASLQIV